MTNTGVGVWLGVDGTPREVEPNLYRYARNSPTNFTDPSGLYTPCKVYWMLNEEAQAAWWSIEHNKGKTETDRLRTGGPHGYWLKDDVDSDPTAINGRDASWNKDIDIKITNADMIQRLIAGTDIEWREGKWAIDYTNRRIWIQGNDRKATELLNVILPALNNAGAKNRWDRKDMNVSFAEENGQLVAKTTQETMKGWIKLKSLGPDDIARGTHSDRRVAMMIWTLQWNQSIKSIRDLASFANFGARPGAFGSLTRVLKLYGDAQGAKELENLRGTNTLR